MPSVGTWKKQPSPCVNEGGFEVEEERDYVIPADRLTFSPAEVLMDRLIAVFKSFEPANRTRSGRTNPPRPPG